jgi:hypothetical protein
MISCKTTSPVAPEPNHTSTQPTRLLLRPFLRGEMTCFTCDSDYTFLLE